MRVTAPIENRPIAGISDLANTVAFESAAAAPLQVPSKQIPLPCARRYPRSKLFIVSPKSFGCCSMSK